MNTRQTWWLTGAAVLLFLFIVFFERRGEDPLAEESASTQLVPGMHLEQVTAVEIHERDKPAIRFGRKGLFWMIESPVYYPSIVASWLQLLERANWVLRLSPQEFEEGQTLADFGLMPPRMRIVVHQGDETTEIRIGNRIPVGHQLYVQVGDDKDVLLTDEMIFTAMPETVDGWRHPALVNLQGRIALGRVEVRAPNLGFTVRPDTATGGWRMEEPIDARADATMISSLLFQLAPNWTIAEFVTDDPDVDLAPFGLDEPSVEFAYSDKTNEFFTLQFGGSPTNRPELIYARQVQFTNVVLTARTNISLLQLPYTYWRDRHLISLNTNEITGIDAEYTFADKTFSYRLLSTTNNLWKVVEPEVLPADGELVRNFFNHMNAIRIQDFEKDVVSDFSEFGLEPPARKFAFTVAANSTRTNGYPALMFGTNASERAFARRSDEIKVYGIDLGHFGALPLAHWQWRDRQIWSFDTNDVKRVIIEQHGKTRELLRTPDARWILAPGSSGVVELSFEEAVYQMSDLRADRWVAKGGATSDQQFGFQDPPHRVSFVVEEQGVTRTNTVEFGGLRDGSHPFAAVVLEDGVKWYFDFPLVPYHKHVVFNFVLPGGE